FSTSAEMLIATRAVLGIAGATLAPSTLSLIRNMFLDPRERTVAIGVWVTSYSVGAAIGPPLGGFLLQHFWWGSVFLVGVPVMVLLLVLGPTLLPEFRDPKARRLDPLSAALSLAAVLAVIYGLKQIAQDGFDRLSVLSIVAGLIVGVVFLRRQGKLADPLIDLRLFRVPAFSASLATYMLGTFVAFGSFFFIAQYLQLVLGMGPLEAGLWTTPFAGAFIVGSMATPVIVRRVHPASLMAAGLVVAVAGFGVLTQVGGTSGPAVLVTGFVIFSLGLAPVFTLATDLIVGSAPPERAGAASAISETSSEFGGALGIAILGSIGTAVYRGVMANAALDGVPTEIMETARNSLGGAMVMAGQLPNQLAETLLKTARASFAQALELTAAISATIAIATAVAAAILLRRVQAGPEPERQPELEPGGTVADSIGVKKVLGSATAVLEKS
ncbi:MAG: MFS transporter, partial [Gammaproteobacteria bacterium]